MQPCQIFQEQCLNNGVQIVPKHQLMGSNSILRACPVFKTHLTLPSKEESTKLCLGSTPGFWAWISCCCRCRKNGSYTDSTGWVKWSSQQILAKLKNKFQIFYLIIRLGLKLRQQQNKQKVNHFGKENRNLRTSIIKQPKSNKLQ